jgi:hypothetical protein
MAQLVPTEPRVPMVQPARMALQVLRVQVAKILFTMFRMEKLLLHRKTSISSSLTAQLQPRSSFQIALTLMSVKLTASLTTALSIYWFGMPTTI